LNFFLGLWPLVAQAQQVPPRHIGVLGADAVVWSSWTAAFVGHLRELGWVEGDNFDIEYRWAGGSSKGVSDFTAEFLRRPVDVSSRMEAPLPRLSRPQRKFQSC